MVSKTHQSLFWAGISTFIVQENNRAHKSFIKLRFERVKIMFFACNNFQITGNAIISYFQSMLQE